MKVNEISNSCSRLDAGPRALHTGYRLHLICVPQIDIGPELASRIIHKAQVFSSGKKIPREQKEPGLFDEAQSILFKEMLSYWAGFCKQYTQAEDENKVKLPRKSFLSK